MKKFLIKTCAFLSFSLILNACTKSKLVTHAQHGDLAGVKREFQEERGRERRYSLNNASLNGHLEVVKYLVEQGVNPSIGLQGASLNGHLEVVKYLVEQGAEANDIYGITDTSKKACKHGYTSLMWASRFGHLEVVKYLVEQGADPNVYTDGGNNAFTFANEEGHLEIADYLASKGAKQEKSGKSLAAGIFGAVIASSRERAPGEREETCL